MVVKVQEDEDLDLVKSAAMERPKPLFILVCHDLSRIVRCTRITSRTTDNAMARVVNLPLGEEPGWELEDEEINVEGAEFRSVADR